MINGIKPEMSTTTKLRIKPTSFDEALRAFCLKLEENSEHEVAKFKFMDSVKFGIEKRGIRFIKVKYYTNRIQTDHETGKTDVVMDVKGSIHCFVEKSTGDIYKPASWRAPYTKGKNAVRGNIYDASSFEKTDMYGGWLYAK